MTLCFRCPNGKNVYGNFSIKSKVDDLFIWVDLNGEIQCKGSQRFDILFSYPLKSLSQERHKSIG